MDFKKLIAYSKEILEKYDKVNSKKAKINYLRIKKEKKEEILAQIAE